MTIKTTLAAAMTSALFCGIAQADELRIAHFMSPKHPMHKNVMAPLADAINKVGGDLSAKIYPAGELGAGPKDQYKRVIDGVADIAFGITEYTPTQFYRTNLIALPGIAENGPQATGMLWAAMDDQLKAEFKRAKLLALWSHDGAVLMTTKKPVNSMADLKGMKIRSPGSMGTKVLKAWGAAPVNMPISKSYNALSTGIVDGILVGASAIKSFKFHEVVKYVTQNVPLVHGAQYLLMNRDSWKALSSDQQKAITDASGKALSMRGSNAYNKAHDVGLGLAQSKKSVTMIDLTPEALAEFKAAADSVYQSADKELAGKNISAKAVLDKMQSAK